MGINLDDLEPLPHERFPQAIAERRFALVAVSEFLIADLIAEGLEGREFRSEVEGLPEGAVVSGVFPDPYRGCVMLRFVHPDLPRVYEGAPIRELPGMIEIVKREEPKSESPEVPRLKIGPGQEFGTLADWLASLPFEQNPDGTWTVDVNPIDIIDVGTEDEG